jgi:hypothetical protein
MRRWPTRWKPKQSPREAHAGQSHSRLLLSNCASRGSRPYPIGRSSPRRTCLQQRLILDQAVLGPHLAPTQLPHRVDGSQGARVKSQRTPLARAQCGAGCPLPDCHGCGSVPSGSILTFEPAPAKPPRPMRSNEPTSYLHVRSGATGRSHQPVWAFRGEPHHCLGRRCQPAGHYAIMHAIH